MEKAVEVLDLFEMKTNLQISFYIASMPDSPTCSEERNWGWGWTISKLC